MEGDASKTQGFEVPVSVVSVDNRAQRVVIEAPLLRRTLSQRELDTILLDAFVREEFTESLDVSNPGS